MSLRSLKIPFEEIEISAIRASGSGGQKVNKTSCAVHLRYDIKASSLPAHVQSKLLRSKDKRITDEGVVVIKAQSHRSFEKNKAEAMDRLQQLVVSALVVQKKRIPTKPSQNARQKRTDQKTARGRTKELRRKPLL